MQEIYTRLDDAIVDTIHRLRAAGVDTQHSCAGHIVESKDRKSFMIRPGYLVVSADTLEEIEILRNRVLSAGFPGSLRDISKSFECEDPLSDYGYTKINNWVCHQKMTPPEKDYFILTIDMRAPHPDANNFVKYPDEKFAELQNHFFKACESLLPQN